MASIIGENRTLPEELADAKEDEALFEETDPFVDGPISIDHGLNFKVGKGSFLNFNLLVLGSCLIVIGENVLSGLMSVCTVLFTLLIRPSAVDSRDRKQERKSILRMMFGLQLVLRSLAGFESDEAVRWALAPLLLR